MLNLDWKEQYELAWVLGFFGFCLFFIFIFYFLIFFY